MGEGAIHKVREESRGHGSLMCSTVFTVPPHAPMETLTWPCCLENKSQVGKGTYPRSGGGAKERNREYAKTKSDSESNLAPMETWSAGQGS